MASCVSTDYAAVDLGAYAFTVAELNKGTARVAVALNELAGRHSRTLVRISEGGRAVGEQVSGVADRNTVSDLLGLLAPEYHPSRHSALVVEGDSGTGGGRMVVFEAAGVATRVRPQHLLGMVLGKVRAQVETPTLDNLRLAVAVPDSMSAAARTAVLDAARIAGLDAAKVAVIPQSMALAEAYVQRHQQAQAPKAAPAGGDGGDSPGPATPARVLLLDVGFAGSSAAVVEVTRTDPVSATLLGECQSCAVGCQTFDERLWDWAVALLQDKHGVAVAPNTRKSTRLLREIAKVRKVLSANASARIVLESFDADRDFSLAVSRAVLEEAVAAETAALGQLVRDCLGSAGVAAAELDAVESVGGGACIPCVQAAVAAVVGEGRVTHTLDGASAVAVGAVHLLLRSPDGAPLPGQHGPEAEGGLSAAALDESRALEAEMQAQDRLAAEIGNARNAAESFLYETRDAMAGRFSGKFDAAATGKLLDELSAWLDELDTGALASPAPIEARLAEARAAVEALNPEVAAAEAAERAAVEAELSKVRAQAEAERAASGENGEDHDNRPLRKEERMKYVLKNKDEATELFKGKNYAHATARYVRALGHTLKFIGLKPEDEAEVSALQGVLHLNVALCYLKQEAWKKARHSCDEGLRLAPTNPKGFYRRALALENLRDLDAAASDLRAGAKLAPDDKAFAKSLARVEAKAKRAREREQQLYSKMFSS